MKMSREMNYFELRACLEQEKTRNKKLLLVVNKLTQENALISEWNLAWQKRRWTDQLVKESDWLKDEIAGLSDKESKVLLYLTAPAQGRHLRAISRATGLAVATTYRAIKNLRERKLARCYSYNSNRKQYYTLKLALLFIKNRKGGKQKNGT